MLSYPLAKIIAFEKNSYGNFYSKVRRLLREGYIVERGGIELKCPVIQLAKKGYEYIQFDLGELREKRFVAQSVTHDYWATVFQIGEFILGLPDNVKFFTEQEIQCTDDTLLPEWVPKSRSHIPDGLTLVTDGENRAVFAIEIDLNLKPLLRYDKAGYYFDAGLSKVDVVLWLCATKWIASEIESRLSGLKLRNPGIHQFLQTADYAKLGWDAAVESGSLKGRTIREIYLSKGYKTPLETPSNTYRTVMPKIFFPNGKSPQFTRR